MMFRWFIAATAADMTRIGCGIGFFFFHFGMDLGWANGTVYGLRCQLENHDSANIVLIWKIASTKIFGSLREIFH